MGAEISDDAERELIEGYLEMRRMGGNAKTITATPRQLESLIRLSEALARMKWARVVERSDVAEAIRLMKASAVGVGLVPQKLVAPKGVKRDSARALTASLLLLLFFFLWFLPCHPPSPCRHAIAGGDPNGRDGPAHRHHRHGHDHDGPLRARPWPARRAQGRTVLGQEARGARGEPRVVRLYKLYAP